MKFIKRIRWAYLLLSVFLIGMGVCLVMWPELSTDMACMIVGGGAMLFGLVKIVFYFVRQVNAMVEQYDFSIGLLSIAAGAVLLIHPEEMLRLLPQVLAVCMLVDCVFKLQVVLDAKRLDSALWFMQLLAVMICIGWGVCLLLQPFGLDKYLSQMFAGGLIAEGVLNLLTVLFIAFTLKKEPVIDVPMPIADPMHAVKPMPAAVAPAPRPEPEEEQTEIEVSGIQVRDLIDQSRETTNQPEGKGSIFSFFKK
ncbi:MAG: DUF308 domain-containing protein [Oscillospiraceae bacterium]|nr:DUF308 domain-containing protein [Oscillospiraceae bacterium]